MRFWTREVAGWVFVALGLFAFYEAYVMLSNRQPIEAGGVSFVGVILFRGGIHLLKVAVAARVCLHAQEEARAQRPGAPAPRTTARHSGVRRVSIAER